MFLASPKAVSASGHSISFLSSSPSPHSCIRWRLVLEVLQRNLSWGSLTCCTLQLLAWLSTCSVLLLPRDRVFHPRLAEFHVAASRGPESSSGYASSRGPL
ncbi:hypothetical protein BDV09DRAFT_176205 [Aspergillus tetrazonus]